MNKPNLWIFGDSFGLPQNHHKQFKNNTDWFWGQQLVHLLGCGQLINHSQMGCSNEYIQYTMMQQFQHIQKDDYVVVITTDTHRAWFFKDRPWLGNITTAIQAYEKNKAEISRSEYQQLKSYVLLNDNDKQGKMRLEAFVGWCHFASQMQHYRLCVLPGFDTSSIHHARGGNLQTIDIGEFVVDRRTQSPEAVWQSRMDFFRNHSSVDPRIAHLSKPNHDVLAHKITTFMHDTYSNKPRDPWIELSIDAQDSEWHTGLYDANTDDYYRCDPDQQQQQSAWGYYRARSA